ncbi:hypothetical protein J3R82DRAFT_11380 [Butyriboletus roseoflavus]|nr:hypothetical protein J3R82DRAFT_11380 [Butyriboletus roseoflavus]
MWFTHDSNEAQAYAQVTQSQPEVGEHHAKLSHEIIAAAASYEAAKAYEQHAKAQGKPGTHEKAVELLAALTGGFIDRIAETKGLNAVDKHNAKHMAEQQARDALARSGEY